MKKYIVQKTGKITELVNGKFEYRGNISLGIDQKGREKVLINIGEKTYSAFLRQIVPKEIREKVNEYRDQLLKES